MIHPTVTSDTEVTETLRLSNLGFQRALGTTTPCNAVGLPIDPHGRSCSWQIGSRFFIIDVFVGAFLVGSKLFELFILNSRLALVRQVRSCGQSRVKSSYQWRGRWSGNSLNHWQWNLHDTNPTNLIVHWNSTSISLRAVSSQAPETYQRSRSASRWTLFQGDFWFKLVLFGL